MYFATSFHAFQFLYILVATFHSLVQRVGTRDNSVCVCVCCHVTRFCLIHPCRYTGCGWVSLAQKGGSWEVRFTGDFSPRDDNGKINSSPTAAVPPVVHLRHGAKSTIKINGMKLL